VAELVEHLEKLGYRSWAQRVICTAGNELRHSKDSRRVVVNH
jgi:hypothetical protein